MAKAVGIGGIFLKARDPKALSLWYQTHLGIPDQGGGSLAFDGPESTGMTVFAHFPRDTEYFGPGVNHGSQQAPQQAMVNLRVDNLDEMLAQLAAAGVAIDPKRDDQAYGRFAWIIDPEGNRVELWEPPAAESA